MTKIKILAQLLLFFNFLFTNQIQSQVNTFRINYDVALFDIPVQSTEALTNGNYIFSGIHANFLPIVSSLTEVNSSGNTVWAKRYSGSISYQFGDFKKDPATNRYYACGGSGNGPAFLIFLDNNGNFISGKDFSIAQADGAFFNRVIKASDGGYVCVGYVIAHDPDGAGPEIKFNSQTNNNASCDQSATETISSPLIVKFDANGNHLWHQVFRHYVTSATPANRIYNDGSFVDVVEVTDGYITVGSYDVNNVFSTFNNDCEDTTPRDAVILKTTTAGAITYYRQIDNPSNATNQSSKSFESASKTAAGLPIFSGTDGTGRPCLLMRLPNSGGWAAPTWIRKFGASSFFGTYDPFLPSRFFETSDGNYALWLNYLTVLPTPSFNNSLMKINPSTNAALWTRRYAFNLAAFLPHGEQTSDGGFIGVSYTLAGTGHDMHVIKTDQDGNVPANCAASNVTVSSEAPSYTYGTPIYNSWNNSTVSNNTINTTVTPITPVTAVECIQESCTPPTFSAQPTNQTICPNGTTTLTGTASAGPYQWQYNNNGTWANVVNGTPTGFSYTNPTTNSLGITSSATTPGIYEFRLQAGNSGCQTASSVVTVTVAGATQAAPTGAQCSGSVINYTALPTSNATYSWSVGAPAGTTASPTTGSASTFSFTATNTTLSPETFAVTVVITSNGVTCSQDLTVLINPAPFAGSNGSTTVCIGQNITSNELFGALTNSPQTGGTWSPTPAGAGTYTYALSNACGNSSAQVLVSEVNCNVTPPPSDTTIFDYTGTDQTYTVPAGVTCLDVRMWGGGGGSADNSNGGYGGGAAFVSGRLNVTPGQVLTIRVGGGGAAGTTGNNAANGVSVYPNGGVGRQQSRGGGNGGGMSGIFLANTPLGIAGAGGGGAGSGSTGGNGTNYCGGVGAAVAQNGSRGGERNGCAQGAGGCGGNANGTNNNCIAPASTFANGFQGGNGESGSFTHGGAGGGGGYAGGQGGASGGNNSGGGGGGSSFFSGTQLNSLSGNTNIAGNPTDFFNQNLFGGGGARSASTNGNTGNVGQNGRIVVIVANQVTPTFTNLPSSVCQQATPPALPTISNEGISGTWTPSSINTNNNGTYTFTPTQGSCANVFSLNVNVINCDTIIYDFTGTDQTYTVPAGVTCLDVRMWGGGGGSADNSNGGYGGGAAFVSGRLNVTPGQVLTIRVGGGGAAGTTGNNAANGVSVYPNGGVGRQQSRGGGNGGGMSGIFLANTPLGIAGAGGGGAGSGSTGGNGTNYCGGVGAAVAQNGSRGGERNGCAQGAGGCGGNANGTNNNCIAPASTFANGFQGGNGESGSFTHGGAGGGGGYAGGQGGASGGNNSGGGGGGSSFFSGTQLNSLSGNTNIAGNPTDFFNQNLFGGGGARSASTNGNTGNVGQNGRIVLIVANASPTSFSNLATILCPGDTPPTLPTTSNEGVTGTWNPATVSNTTTATYTFTPNPTECAQPFTTTVTVLNNPTVTSTSGNNTICAGSSLTLTSSPAQTYQWFRDGAILTGETGQSINITQAGSYTVSVSGGNCAATSSAFVVTEFNPVIVSQGGSTQICNGNPVIMNVSGGDSYQWLLNGNPINGATSATYSASTAGNYSVIVSSGTCNVTTAVFPVSIVNPTISSANGLNVICDGGNILLNASGGTNYQWFFNGVAITGATNPTFTANQTGSYTVQVNAGGCAAQSAAFIVAADAGPNALFYPSNPVFTTTPQTVSFVNASTGATSYFWEFGDGGTSTDFNVSHVFNNTYSGATITLTAISQNGCTSQSVITIDYAGEDLFFIPNTFTPDGDQFNQTFLPVFSGNVDPYNYHLMIFNRWGELIWESFDPRYGWDGTYTKNGIQVQQGSYIWKINYKLQNNDKRKTIAGHLNLLK
jgi:gliding motility-associated-like protein